MKLSHLPNASVNKSDEKNQENFDLISLEQLAEETKMLFRVLDISSRKIREFESCMGDLKAHFPFRCRVFETNSGGSCYLAWEKDDNSSRFRLYLIIEEQNEFGWSDEVKKPLIETPLDTRLRVSGHVVPFIKSFTEYLSKYRVAIERNCYDDIPY
jgi:hypothetical protein